MSRKASGAAATLRPLEQPAAGRLTLRYLPEDGSASAENPPRFTWLPTVDSGDRYVLQIASTLDFRDGETRQFADIGRNFFTPDAVLPAGRYFWRYAVWDGAAERVATQWSVARQFSLEPDAAQTPLAQPALRYPSGALARPRLWLRPGELATFSAAVRTSPDHCGWSTFFEKSVTPWTTRPVMAEPKPYPGNVRTADIWRRTYIECQEAVYAIRHLAVAGRVLQDDALIERAREWLLAVAAWDPAGPTSRVYTDEWAFRVTLALAWGYDWLHDALAEAERLAVRTALLARTREIAEHCIRHARLNIFPFDSHAVRALSAVLVPACIALLDEAPEAREWLDFTVEFLMTVYSPWGDADGGWAEGPHYWMTGLAYLTDAANLLRKFCGIDLYARPFFQRTGDFPLYTKAADTRRATFGDDSTMGDPVCLKVGGLMRQFAGVTGNGVYQWYCDEVRRADPGTEMAFYNYGWWDLNFDELVYAHDYPEVAPASPAGMPRLKWFRGIGWAAIQVAADDPDRHIHFVTKASPYGSVSHSNADQNAFTLSAFGEDLAIQSGHYVAFNSTMHQNWRRQTVSKNAVLIDGKGQYAGADKAQAIRACGRIETAEQRDNHVYIRGDATEAYAALNPAVTRTIRETYFVDDTYFVFVDSVAADTPVTLDWLIHTEGPMRLGSDTFRYEGRRAGFYGQFVWASAGDPTLMQHEGFADVLPEEVAGLPIHWHLKARYPAATRHRIVTVLIPYLISAPRRIFHFTDDQGYNTDLYFVDEADRSFKIVLPKSFNP
ncbi:MAG: DUF4962 domain-containing protein [Beijerinckiaceae bacterium]